MIFDTEMFIKNSIEIVESKLPDVITALNTEKGDYELKNIPYWYFQNLSAQCFSYPRFGVYYLVENNTLESAQNNNSIELVNLSFEVCLYDSGDRVDQNINWQILRYTRALKSVFHQNFDRIRSGTKTTVKSLIPNNFQVSGKTYKTGGVLIQAAISSN